MQELRLAEKPRTSTTVSKAFEAFLDRVTKRDAGASYASLNWVGETYYGLGTGFDASAGTLSIKAKTYFDKATTAYANDRDGREGPQIQDNPNLTACGCGWPIATAAPASTTTRSKRCSSCCASSRAHNAQVQAAEIHQCRGIVDPAAYALAIRGSNPGKDGKNLIWGWNRISLLTANKPSSSKRSTKRGSTWPKPLSVRAGGEERCPG